MVNSMSIEEYYQPDDEYTLLDCMRDMPEVLMPTSQSRQIIDLGIMIVDIVPKCIKKLGHSSILYSELWLLSTGHNVHDWQRK